MTKSKPAAELGETIEHRGATKKSGATASTVTFVADQRSAVDRKADEKTKPKPKGKAKKTKAERELAPTEPVEAGATEGDGTPDAAGSTGDVDDA